MSAIWGSVWGDRLWLWLRGEDFLEPAPRPLQSLSRQHILPPASRTRDKARGIAVKLLLSTARKMRRHGLWAGCVGVQIGYQEGKVFEMGVRIPPSQDNYTLQQHFLLVWERSPRLTPSDIAVILSDLGATPQVSFFEPDQPNEAERVAAAVDQLNLRYGLHTVYSGSIHDVLDQAPHPHTLRAAPPLEEFDIQPTTNVLSAPVCAEPTAFASTTPNRRGHDHREPCLYEIRACVGHMAGQFHALG